MRSLLVVALSTSMAAVAPSPARAAVYYVDRSHPAASDANPGTEASPWRTIQHAADTLTAGDTVWVKAGTYAELVTINSVGAQGQEIVFAAYPGHVVTVDGSSVTLPPWRGLVMIQFASWVRLRGLRVANAGPEVTSTGIQVEDSTQVAIEQNHTVATASSGILVWNSSDVLLADNEVEQAMTTGANSRNECITVGRTTRFEVRGNHVHDTNAARGEGICAKDGSSYGTVHHNHVHHVPRVGIYVDAWTEYTHHIDVFANRVHDVAGDDPAAGSGIAVASEQGGLLEQVRFYNNVSYYNRLLGLEISDCCIASHPLVDVQVVNNSFWGNGWTDWGGGIGNANNQTTRLVLRNNAVAGNLSFEITFEGVDPAGTTLENNLIGGWHGYPGELCGAACRVGDPLWVNPAAGDFHLQPGSPAIDGGTTQTAPTVDFDGRLRDALPDMGAFEWSLFADVAAGHWARPWIEALYRAGVTAGCGTNPLRYCPEAIVNRAQMAVFLLRGRHGSGYVPPPATGTVFADVPASHWAAAWIEQLAAEGITSGCGGGNYCPASPVSRAQMAVFLLRAEHGSAYVPPPATGTVFADVPPSHWAAAWIEQLAAEGITSGCGGGNYCPESSVSRAQMAVFLVRTFNLPL